MLNTTEEISLKETYNLIVSASGGDDNAMEKIITENMGLVHSVIKKLRYKPSDYDDLVQIGTIGLIKAVKKFDTSYGVMFSTYAVPMVLGEIRRFLRDDGPIKVSRSYKTISYKASKIRDEILKKTGKEPTIGEIAKKMDIDVSELATALEAVREPESLYIFSDETQKTYLVDKVCLDKNMDTKLIDKIALEDVISKLPDNEKKVIILRYFRDKTQCEIAKLMGISQVQVSRIEKRVLLKLHESFS